MAWRKAKHERGGKRGFMVISFVIALSLAMFGTLRSLAIMSAEQAALKYEMEGRSRADEIALDCIYLYSRILMVHGSMDRMRSARIPVTDGFCAIEGLDEALVYDETGHGGTGYGMSGTNAIGVHASFVVRADLVPAGAHGVGDGISLGVGASSDGSAPVFHSRIHAEIRVVNGTIDLIRI